MMRTHFIYLFLIVVHVTSAQDTLGFSDCVRSACERNWNIQKQKTQIETYHLNVKKAQDARLPNISANVNSNLNWGRGIDPFTNTFANQQFNTYNGSLNLDMPLFNGFYHIQNIKLQKQSLEANKSEWQQIKNNLTIDIAMRYTNILYLREQVRNLREQIQFSQSNIEFTQKKIDAGALAKKEIYKAIAQKDNEELNLLRIENDLEINLYELKLLIGWDVEKQIVLREFESIPSSIIDKKRFISSAIESAPSLQIQKNNLEKSQIGLEMAKSSYYPTISLGGQLGSTYSTLNRFYNFNEQIDNNLSYGFNINARIPIFSQFQTRNKIKEARLNIQSTQIALELEKINQLKVFNKAFLDLTTSEKKLSVSKSQWQSNLINYETEKLKYEVGRLTLQELNISKSNLLNAISSLTRDKYEWIFNTIVYHIYEGKEIDGVKK